MINLYLIEIQFETFIIMSSSAYKALEICISEGSCYFNTVAEFYDNDGEVRCFENITGDKEEFVSYTMA